MSTLFPPPRRRRPALSVGLVLLAWLPTAGKAADDIVLADFEGGTYAGWKLGGTAFGSGPAPLGKDAPLGAIGHGYATSAPDPGRNLAALGSLDSPEFVIERDYLNFLIGGGDHAFRAALVLWVDGKVERTNAGNGIDRLAWASWDVRALRGRRASLGLYDRCLEDPQGYVMVDEIRLADSPRAAPSGDVAAALAQVRQQAVAAIRRNAPVAAADPQRPAFHYAPPAQRMNDPNGPAWYNGWHHLFYQHMVFEGSGPAIDVHWGHARSRDLVHWETLPLAIAPAYELGEQSCFSGNLAWDAHGEPVQFVTMVPYRRDTFRQIWPARPLDPDWIRWARTPERPPGGLVPSGPPDRSLKDAFPFAAGDRRFLVLTDRDIPLYEATDARLTQWVYRGPLFPQSAECPNFFAVDGRWIYLSSPHEPVRYVVGDFDPAAGRFTARTEGRLNHDLGYYATTAYRDEAGRTILHGVSRGQKSSPAWTGALALPRVLTLGPDDRPRMRPVPALADLRRDSFRLAAPVPLAGTGQVVTGLRGDTMELIARFRPGRARAFGLRVRRADDGKQFVPVEWREGRIIVAKDTPKFPCRHDPDPTTGEVRFHVFLDRGMLDVCVDDGRIFESRVHPSPPGNLGVEVFAEGGDAVLISLEAWQLAPARVDHSRLLRPE